MGVGVGGRLGVLWLGGWDLVGGWILLVYTGLDKYMCKNSKEWAN